MIVDTQFELRRDCPSDINEHMETLKSYATGLDTVVEMGVRSVVSTWAFLAGRPKRLISIDKNHPKDFTDWFPKEGLNSLELAESAAKEAGIDFNFVLGDSLKVDIPECDLLFLDTDHSYKQVKAELDRHAAKVKKYIIFHDTETSPEINVAIGELKGWRICERFANNNGLTVIKCL